MSNFKSGSGNLDFGDGGSGETGDEATDDRTEPSDSDDESAGATPDVTARERSRASNEGTPGTSGAADESDGAGRSEYPYFVRRSNVGDERDTRLEIHVRDKVADREGTFRAELAERLDASEISKTDAREFALLAAFRHPERVAELMESEGFGEL
jgi:hypothetical protein